MERRVKRREEEEQDTEEERKRSETKRKRSHIMSEWGRVRRRCTSR